MVRFAKPITRRQWSLLLGAMPLAAQVPAVPSRDSNPPSGPPPLTTTANLPKASATVRQISDQLSKIEVPMNIEPAFSFKA